MMYWTELRTLVARVAILGGPLVLTTGSALLALSAIAHASGSRAFVALAVGQSVGTAGVLLASWGFDVSGPTRVAMAEASEHRVMLTDALIIRSLLGACILPGQLVIAVALAPDGMTWLTTVSVMSIMVVVASPSWWLIGTSRLGALFLIDSAPRILAGLLSALAINRGAPAVAFPVTTLVLVATSYSVFYAIGGSWRHGMRSRLAHVWRGSSSAAGVSVIAGAYTAAALPVVQASSPGVAIEFASVVKLLGYCTLAISTLTSTVVPWAVVDGAVDVRRRRVGLLLYAAVGLTMGVALAIAGRLASRFLFTEASTPTDIAFVFAGLAFFLIAVGTALARLYLIPESLDRKVLHAVIVAAVVGVPSLLLLPHARGTTGAGLALALAELAATSWLMATAWRARSGPSSRTA